ncbi:MAG TPA: dihydrofolate reductase, partial [Acidobacteriota bacterium]|nr:dihydrofolate reductase [Acidobacteriota bacterium]
MDIYLIAAIGDNYVIGKDGKMPWNVPEDLKLFRENTLNSNILMGRKTFESIGRPLPKRKNIVLSTSMKPHDGVYIGTTLEEALAQCDADKNLFVIGGATLYEQTLPLADKLYISHIKGSFEGDTFFPHVNFAGLPVLDEKKFA